MVMFSHFTTSVNLTDFLFKGLDITNAGEVVGLGAVLFAVAFGFEGLKLLQIYLELRKKQNPLTYGRMESSVNDRDILLSSLMIPADMKQIRRTKIKFHTYGCLGHTGNSTISYIIMLAVMTYSVWAMLAVVLGAGLGYLVFSRVGESVISRFLALTSLETGGEREVQPDGTTDSSAADNPAFISTEQVHI